ncbi:CHAP domain-containing protein [Streptomyces sp. TLI_235]|nr:CHAP domain-containing protein [Streptomyces sp. TLI_235]PBC80019.1 CHAP domain-containing protein [Streptomyces sp. TLI_235]
MPSINRTVLRTLAVPSLAALMATGALAATPAHASTGSTVASVVTGEIGNGPCAHGGYTSGDGTSNSCGSGGHKAHSWCADFAGWAWTRAGAGHLGYLSGAARDFYDYGVKYGTLHSTPSVGDAVVFNYNRSADWADHVAIVTAVSGGSVTVTGGNQATSQYPDGRVTSNTTTNWGVGARPWGQTISGYISPVGGSASPAPGTGTAHVEIIGSDGAMYNNDGNYAAGSWSTWTKMDSANLVSLASASTGSTSHFFAVAADGRVYTRDADYAAGTWSDWAEVPGGAGGAKAVTATATGSTVHVEIVGADGAMYNNDGNYAAGNWSTWTKMDSANLVSLASATTGNTSHFFAVAADGRVYTRDADYESGTWSDWAEVPGGAGGAKAVTATVTANNAHVEIIGSDGAMYNNDANYAEGTWSTWTKMDSGTFKSLASASVGNTSHFFAVAADGRVYTRDADYSAGRWTDWTEVPGGAGGAKAITATVTS